MSDQRIDYKAMYKLRQDKEADFLEDMALKGLPLTPDQVNILKKAGRDVKKLLELTQLDEEGQAKFEKSSLGFEIKIPEFGNGNYKDNGVDIKAADWMPDSVIKHSDEFYDFILSMNEQGFQRKTSYKPFELYIQQAHN